MKRTEKCENAKEISDEMRSEYRFDYNKARPNRFAKHDSETDLPRDSERIVQKS